jgi:PAS domain S-box-containing protein
MSKILETSEDVGATSRLDRVPERDRHPGDRDREDGDARHREVEASLRESQRFLSAVLGALPTRIAVVDERGTLLAVNTAWERYSGPDLVSHTVGLGSNYLAACDAAARDGSEEAAKVAAAIRQILAREQEEFSLEYPCSDRERWFITRVVAFKDSGPPRAVLAFDEVTKRKRAQEALFQNVRRTQLILESAVDAILTIDESGRIESVNPAAERMFGYPASELLGRNVGLLMGPEHHERHDDYIRRYLDTGEARIIGVGREIEARRKDGTLFPIELAVSEFFLGDRRFFMGTIRDVTERKEIEEALRRERDFAESLVETAQAIVLVLDSDGRIVRFNRYLEEISGRRLAEVRGEDWFDLFLPAEERARVRQVFTQVLAGHSMRGVVGRIVTRDGSEREIEWYNTTLGDVEGGVLGVLAVGQDITERRQLEEQFRQAQKMEAIGRLAGGVAHDFNTLLGSITGYSELLLGRVEEPALRHPVEQIHRAAERGAGLTRQLLAFGRRQVLKPTVLDLNRVVGEMDDMLRRLIAGDIELVYDLEPELGPVKVDPGQIEQVVMNLIVNAVDAIGSGGRITLATRNVELDEAAAEKESVLVPGHYAMLGVSDDGCGMPEEVRAQIFDPFFTTKEQGKGTGLGLSTVYGIVRQSGGGIAVETAPGEGTTFKVYLLRVDEELEEAAAEPEPPPSRRGSETVLLVEDDPMFLELLGEVLEANGYTVLSAGDPAEAIEICERSTQPVDLLVSDMVMPGMSGSDLARRLLERQPEMRVLLMSGYTDEALEDRGVLDDGRSFLQKPFGTKDFIRIIREILDPVE